MLIIIMLIHTVLIYYGNEISQLGTLPKESFNRKQNFDLMMTNCLRVNNSEKEKEKPLLSGRTIYSNDKNKSSESSCQW